MSEEALVQALNEESANPVAPTQTVRDAADRLSARASDPARAARRAERAQQAAEEKAAPRLSRSERMAAAESGVTPDEALADKANEVKRTDEIESDEEVLTAKRRDLSDPEEELEDAPKVEIDPQEGNPYDLPEETEFTDKSGKTYKIPRELVEGALRQADYTRGKQELAELKRSAVAEKAMQAVNSRVLSDLAPAIAQIHNIRQMNDADRGKLPDPEQDPIGYIKLDKLIRDREAVAQALERQVADKRTEYATQQQSLQNELLHSGMEYLKRVTKGQWTPRMQQEVAQYAIAQGYAPEELTAQFDPRFVHMAFKAMQFDRRQVAPQTRQAPKAPIPTPKPQAPQRQRDSRVDELKSKVRRTGSVNDAGDAIAALLDRSRRR